MQTHCRSRRDSTSLTSSPVLKFRNRCRQFSQGRWRVPGYLSWIPVCLEGASGTAAGSTLTSLWPALLNVWRKASVPWMENLPGPGITFHFLLLCSLLLYLQRRSFTRYFAGFFTFYVSSSSVYSLQKISKYLLCENWRLPYCNIV